MSDALGDLIRQFTGDAERCSASLRELASTPAGLRQSLGVLERQVVDLQEKTGQSLDGVAQAGQQLRGVLQQSTQAVEQSTRQVTERLHRLQAGVQQGVEQLDRDLGDADREARALTEQLSQAAQRAAQSVAGRRAMLRRVLAELKATDEAVQSLEQEVLGQEQALAELLGRSQEQARSQTDAARQGLSQLEATNAEHTSRFDGSVGQSGARFADGLEAVREQSVARPLAELGDQLAELLGRVQAGSSQATDGYRQGGVQHLGQTQQEGSRQTEEGRKALQEMVAQLPGADSVRSMLEAGRTELERLGGHAVEGAMESAATEAAAAWSPPEKPTKTKTKPGKRKKK